MARRFFNIPLGRVPALVQAQNFLRRHLDNATYVDPDNFHMTLVFVEDDNGADLGGENPAANLPAFGVGGSYISRFDTSRRPRGSARSNPASRGRYAIHMSIDRSPPLIFLQSALYYKAEAAGAKISRHSFPNAWRPHVTLAYTDEPEGDDVFFEMPVPFHIEVGGFTLSEDENTVLNTWGLLAEVSVQEFVSQHTAALTSESTALAQMLNRHLDEQDSERPDLVQRMAQQANMEADAVYQVLASESHAPSLAALHGFATALGLPEEDLERWATLDKALPSDAKPTKAVPIHVSETIKDVEGRNRITMTFLSEMRGPFPDLSLPADINRSAMLSEVRAVLGQDAKFVTLPVGQVGAVSGNKRKYGRQAMEDMSRQINEMRPEGTFGHTPSEKLATEYIEPSIRWLASEIIDDTVWAKGLPLTEKAQNHFRLARATNSRVGTSLQAWADVDGENVNGLDLIKLDIADPARVGIPMTAAQPSLTSEMASNEGGPDHQIDASDDATGRTLAGEQSNTSSEELEEHDMGESSTDRVSELLQDKRTLQEQLDTRDTEIRELQPFKQTYEDICEHFELDTEERNFDLLSEMKRFARELSEIRKENQALLEEAMDSSIEELVAIEHLRPIVKDMVVAMEPSTRKELERVLEDVLGRTSIKGALQRELETEMGSPHRPSTSSQSRGDGGNGASNGRSYITIPGREEGS